jgi:hypothetical protein
MRVAYIGHSHHRRTRSTRFLIDLLEQHATVEQWFGEPGRRAAAGWGAGFDENRYDIIVIFQLYEAFELLTGRHPNVAFVPMYDAMQWAGSLYWKPAFDGAKILCFSWAIRQEMMRRGVVHALFQYYPDPALHEPVQDFDTLRGFLWYRRREITPDVAFDLCRGTEFDQFTIHEAPDPGNEMDASWVPPPNIRRLDRTTWSSCPEAYNAALRNSNVFFAPRPHEGIGMSVLEAMASGHCVVAPDAATMNEYISHGTNGLLYPLRQRTQIEFNEARAIGARARESVERGHQRWLDSVPALLDFLATPTTLLRDGPRSSIPVRNRFAVVPTSPAGRPLVSIVTVCRDAAAVLETTMQSVLDQTGCDFEYVVIDCLSTDGCSDIIRRHADRLAAWQRVPSDAAMRKAVDLVRGDWVLFLDAGATFVSEDALRRMFARASAADDVTYGNLIVRFPDGSEGLRRATDFEVTWARLQRGAVCSAWLAGVPSLQATAVRRELLARLGLDAGYGVAAGMELLFRARAHKAHFFNCDEVIAIQTTDSTSPQARERLDHEWMNIVRSHGGDTAAEQFQAHMVASGAASGERDRAARLGHFALRMIVLLDRHSPVLARAVERFVRSAVTTASIRRFLRLAPVGDPNWSDEAGSGGTNRSHHIESEARDEPGTRPRADRGHP